ncbi:TetR/AcrR family transcriptional regulator [Chitinophaga rhizophila]|uniref:TetR/AcrR family transcriptional regulator n=1 Tax=Chitinophaga rhizophila TaxID=2866212 RepID=A0ABS7GIJ0_9BACT|nr:TetR/AcrR family transcriptional regulator [Chitinophaga rhizophila]MBW8686492.1 TetR/AcrR family transcriptional regulator [Chitinophaga rhizophila]
MDIQERILDTAFSLFCQFGTRSITMDDIAQRMGVSKKTLYAHFADKDELVMHAISRYLNHLAQECVEYQDKAANAIDELFLVMKMLDQSFRNMNPIILFDLQKFHVKAFQVFQDYKYNNLQKTVRQNLERGVREGLYRSDFDIEIMTQYRLATSMLCFQPDIFPYGKYDMSKVQCTLLEHFLYGLVSPEGYKRVEENKLQLQ